MAECRHCGEYIPDNKEKRVRCPRCREPLFERAGGPERVSGTPPADKPLCAIHQGNAAIGTCKRCGNPFCLVCRTRWNEQVFCAACVERLVGSEEENPDLQTAHARQAILALVCGALAWVLVALGGFALFMATGHHNPTGTLFMALVLVVSSLLPALLGLGQAFSALRARGHRLALATSGLVLSGAHVGVFLGAILLLLVRS